jgi:hypothetical protein
VIALPGVLILLVFLIDQRKFGIIGCAIVKVLIDSHGRLLQIVTICKVCHLISNNHGSHPSMIRCHQSLPYFYKYL